MPSGPIASGDLPLLRVTKQKARGAPTLSPGEVEILDNRSSRKSARTAHALRTVRAWFLFLPPCSPDRDTIEMAVSKLRTASGEPPRRVETGTEAPRRPAAEGARAFRRLRHRIKDATRWNPTRLGTSGNTAGGPRRSSSMLRILPRSRLSWRGAMQRNPELADRLLDEIGRAWIVASARKPAKDVSPGRTETYRDEYTGLEKNRDAGLSGRCRQRPSACVAEEADRCRPSGAARGGGVPLRHAPQPAPGALGDDGRTGPAAGQSGR